MTYDLVIVGAGILGSSVAYLASLSGLRTALVERESAPGTHSTYRNTGVVHRPFYIDPRRRRASALASQRSYHFLRSFCARRGLTWSQVGTLEVAYDEEGARRIEDYRRYAIENGMDESEFSVLYDGEIREAEPHVKGISAFLSLTDAVVSFRDIAERMAEEAGAKGADLLFRCRADRVEDGRVICGERELRARAVVVAAGAESFTLAMRMGLRGYAQLHFRGDYWRLSERKAQLFRRNIYTVPRFSDFPFLDPHIVKRHTGHTEIGPNAFLVPGPYDYTGTLGVMLRNLLGTGEGELAAKLRLLMSPELLRLVVSDWSVSLFRSSMVRRVSRFAEGISSKDLVERGISGIRHNLISGEGFVQEPLIYVKGSAVFVLNYNSPGATGSPWYASQILRLLREHGLKAESQAMVGSDEELGALNVIEG
ncbi:MAG: NAD(P)/FAD-dependent oxidoreductase [Nitrososphaeria archaeon]